MEVKAELVMVPDKKNKPEPVNRPAQSQ